MADPTSIDNRFKRTYTLTVPILDLMGDSPVTAGIPVMIALARADGAADQPLFGPDGLLVGAMTQEVSEATARPAGTALAPANFEFSLIPNGYWFVPTVYLLTVGGRTYRFTMPAEDTSIITLLGTETTATPSSGDSGVVAIELPTVESVADAAGLANAQSIAGREPIFAKVMADFNGYRTGDVLIWQGATDGWALLVRTHELTPRSRGLLIAWWGAGALPAEASRSQASIQSSRPLLAVSHDGTGAAVKLNVALPDALVASLDGILVDGHLWTPEPLVQGATAIVGSIAYRLYSSREAVDISGGIGPLALELALR